ncbi:MAG: hypothetical protein HYV20_17660 [Gemmatimonadetes bacterium]|nr:hypothetical protein [Gemmatimonadota bacterium]
MAGAAAGVGAVLWETLGGGFFSGTPPGDGRPESVRGWVARIPIPWP